jgi:malonate-semialdehyde dehydrogenase (acetylating) / methylmalonate-semialdehyde dehydrogenase
MRELIKTNIKKMKNNINGEWVDSTGTDVEEVINPADGTIIA